MVASPPRGDLLVCAKHLIVPATNGPDTTKTESRFAPGIYVKQGILTPPHLQTSTVRSRRWGVSALVVTEVVELVEPERIVEEQVRGPLGRWRHELHFRAAGDALTEVSERIDYEPPGGLLGLTLTPGVIEAELAEAFAWRQARVRELLGGSS